ASAQRNQQVIRHVFLREAHLVRFRPVHLNMKFWIVERLLNSQVYCTGNKFKFVDQAFGEKAIRRQIAAYYLNIERSRQSKIENLGDDINRQLVESDSRKIVPQLHTQLSDIFFRRPVILREFYLNISISGSDRSRC